MRAPCLIHRQRLPFAIQSLAAGKFTSRAMDLAALGDDGRIHILERSDANEPLGLADAQALHAGPEGVAGSSGNFAFAATRRRTQSPTARPTDSLSAGRPGVMPQTTPQTTPKTTAMSLSKSIDLPSTVRQTAAGGAKLVSARVAGTDRDSVIVLYPAGRRLHLISHLDREDAASLSVALSLDHASVPAAVQAMRINKDPFNDLVVLADHQSEPVAFHTAPQFTYIVKNTNDTGFNSLRDSLGVAATVGGTSEIDFDIPLTDPNRDPSTGVFTIQPTGLNDLEALPNLSGSITVDGFTRPGSSPNTLTNGINAHPLN